MKIAPGGESQEQEQRNMKEVQPCSKCLQENTGPGIPHPCGQAARKANLVKLTIKEGEGAEQVVASVFKHIKNQNELDDGDEIKLKQLKGGTPVKVVIGTKRKVDEVHVTSETVAKVKKVLKLSGRDTEKLCGILREDELKVEQNTRKFLSEVDNILLPYYEVKKMRMKVKVTKEGIKLVRGRGGKMVKKKVKKTEVKTVDKDVVIVKDAKEFCEEIARMRGIRPENTQVRVCQDGGGGSFKTVVSVMDSSIDLESEAAGEKLSGVNRLLPLVVCRGIPESNHNMRLIMEHLSLHRIPRVSLSMDLCLCNAVLGVSPHGGKYSCCFCDGTSILESGTLRTFQHLKQKYEAYIKAGAEPKQMMHYANVIAPCLISAPPSAKVIDVVSLPELHMHMGVTNHLVKHAIKYDADVLEVLKKHNIFRHGYQGGGLDGNTSNKFLKKLEAMEDDILPVLHPVLNTLLMFRSVVEGCFSWDLAEDFKARITAFTTSYRELMAYSVAVLEQPLTVTWKVHCVSAHLAPFLEKHGQGLANISEQVGESAHHAMKPQMQRHQRSESNPVHGEMQLRAVVKFGSWNVYNMTGRKKSKKISKKK